MLIYSERFLNPNKRFWSFGYVVPLNNDCQHSIFRYDSKMAILDQTWDMEPLYRFTGGEGGPTKHYPIKYIHQKFMEMFGSTMGIEIV